MQDGKPHILIVEARFYAAISDALFAGAARALDRRGVSYERIAVPGALEIPAAIRYAAIARDAGRQAPFDGFIALGCVIRGETTHYETVCAESARGLMDLTIRHGLAIGNGILTVENEEQAWVRARPEEKDKGGDAAAACLALLEIKNRFGHYHEI